MSDDYDVDGPEGESEPASTMAPVMKLRAEGEVSVAYLVERATADVLRFVDKQIEKKVDEKLEAAVDAAFSEAIKARVQRAVDEVLEKGFPKIDEYGRNTGTKPLAERVAEELGRRGTYDRRDRFAEMVSERFGRLLDKALAPHVERAEEEFKGQVDAVIKAKLAETLKTALGLGR